LNHSRHTPAIPWGLFFMFRVCNSSCHRKWPIRRASQLCFWASELTTLLAVHPLGPMHLSRGPPPPNPSPKNRILTLAQISAGGAQCPAWKRLTFPWSGVSLKLPLTRHCLAFMVISHPHHPKHIDIIAAVPSPDPDPRSNFLAVD